MTLPVDASGEHLNQSPVFRDINLYATNPALIEAVAREGGGHADASLEAFGAEMGSAAAFERGRLANEHPPRLRAYDEKGRRIDVVELHPAYHECMAISMRAGLHCGSWGPMGAAPPPGANVVRAAGSFLACQMEAGHCCPITMTNAAAATLRFEPALAADWLPRLLARDYDRSLRPWTEKSAVTLGMGMTERQGGTDVRANTSTAAPIANGGPGGEYVLSGHKWFLSAPMSDGFLMLAQAPGGLSCFLVPRLLPDGRANGLRLMRLKDKLGNRSNASAEVEFDGTLGWLVGEEGRGVASIIEMVTYTRLDCAVSSAGLMRLGLASALLHSRHRSVFRKRLVEQPMMRAVLADLAIEVEAATALAFRLAHAFDRPDDPIEQAWRRVMTPVTKYWICKVAPGFGYEAMECLGGNGYVEDGLLARVYRELPVNAIWEGSGNVMCLDVLRVLMREVEAAELILEGLTEAAKGERRIQAAMDRVREILHRPRDLEQNGRALVEGIALVAASVLLVEHAPPSVADAFIGARLASAPHRTYGVAVGRADVGSILERAWGE